jgi:hypothetical protein
LASLSISNFYDQPIAMQWAFLCLNAASFKLNAMMKFLGLLLCCGGCVLLYLTHPNQTVLKQTVAKKYRWVGWIGFFGIGSFTGGITKTGGGVDVVTDSIGVVVSTTISSFITWGFDA